MRSFTPYLNDNGIAAKLPSPTLVFLLSAIQTTYIQLTAAVVPTHDSNNKKVAQGQ
jgi:hypothetical protein